MNSKLKHYTLFRGLQYLAWDLWDHIFTAISLQNAGCNSQLKSELNSKLKHYTLFRGLQYLAWDVWDQISLLLKLSGVFLFGIPPPFFFNKLLFFILNILLGIRIISDVPTYSVLIKNGSVPALTWNSDISCGVEL